MLCAGCVRKSKPLNSRQLDVLRRISSGEDVGVDSTAKTSARALDGRGLVTVSTRGGWHVEITDAGRFYLDHDHHPDRPCGANAACGDQQPPDRQPPSSKSKRPPPHTTARIVSQRRAAATDLVAKLIEQREVVISHPDDDELAEWRKIVDFTKRHGLVPAGHRIEKSRWYGRDLHIRLCEGSHPNAKPSLDPSQRIEVPEHVERLHPLLAHLKDPAAVLDVSMEQVERALRIMHTVFTEADRREYETGWADDTSVGAEIRVDGFRVHVTLTEEWETREVVPTPAELSGKKVYGWQRFQPEMRSVRSGKLRIQVTTAGVRFDRPAKWADRQRWNVENKLGEVLAEIDGRVKAEQDRIAAKEQARLQRQHDWEVAMSKARAHFQEDRRITALNKQLDGWRKAAEIRAYCEAVEEARRADDDADGSEGQARWLEWCRSHADQIDPTRMGASGPNEAEPGPSDLTPYLGRFSPYGP